jgi:broad specificity phosphatase PhoE
MKTRKNSIRNHQTRKGGKTARENLNNYISYWSGVMKNGERQFPQYNGNMNYPGRLNKLKGQVPTLNESNVSKTFIFTRHGYSCANLLKSQKSYQQFTDPDPSLTIYGIVSILKTIQDKPPEFNGKVFVSSLIRTWQTAILEYGSYGPLTIIVSPFIKEKHSHSFDVANFPLPRNEQIAKMKLFLGVLNGIDHVNAKRILQHKINVQYGPVTFTLDTNVVPIKTEYVDTIQSSMMIDRRPPEMKRDLFIPAVTTIPEPSFTKYYGAEGFSYFNHWVQSHPDKTIFVVSHSGFMKSILKKYDDMLLGSSVFDENVWKLVLEPQRGEYNYRFQILPGLKKPTSEMLEQFSKMEEPLCHRVRNVEDHPTSLLPKDNVSMNEGYSDPVMTNTQTPLLPLLPLEPSNTPIQDMDQTPIAYHSKTDPYESKESYSPYEESKESYPPYEESKESKESYSPYEESKESYEETKEPPEIKVTAPELPARPQKGKLLRSYRILFEFITNKQNLSELIALVNSKEPFKKKCMDYIRSHDIFSNHYLAFVLMYPPYLKRVIENLDSSVKQTAIYTYITYCFGASNVSVKKIRDFLIEFSEMIKTDEDLYNVMIDTIRSDSNTFYYHNFSPMYFFGTLLDLFYYEMYVYRLTDDTKEFTFKVIRDLISKGARFSKPIPPRNMNDLVDSIELLSDEEIVEKMELLQIPYDTKYKDDLKAYFSTQLINKLSRKEITIEKIQPYFIYADMITKDGAIDDSKLLNRYKCPILSPDVEFLVEPTMVVDPSDGNLENYFKKHILSPLQKHELMGGFRGTSSKRSSLRRFSVKGGRYRVLQYKGKRRSRANRR